MDLPRVILLLLALARLGTCPQARADPLEQVEFKLHDDGLGMATLELGGRTLQVAVDTGATMTVIDNRFRDRLGTTIARYFARTTHASSSVAICRNSGGTVGPLKLNLPRLACGNLGRAVRVAGIDGLLGMDFLKCYCVDFDWDAQTLRISRLAPDVAGRGVKIKLTYLEDGMPCITADVGEILNVRMGVDTGSSISATLSTVDQPRIFPNDFGKAMEVTIVTVGGPKRRLITRLPPITVHGLEARELLCDVGFVISRDTLLGCGWLRRYRAIFDFPRDTLILIERANLPVDESDMSGLYVGRNRDDVVIVDHVADNTPASRAGFHGGEIIKAVDGVPAAELEIWKIRKRLKSGDGKTVRLEVKDGDAERTVDLVLTRRV
jgi:aspartyl protease/PDZ domain-containing protein